MSQLATTGFKYSAQGLHARLTTAVLARDLNPAVPHQSAAACSTYHVSSPLAIRAGAP